MSEHLAPPAANASDRGLVRGICQLLALHPGCSVVLYLLLGLTWIALPSEAQGGGWRRPATEDIVLVLASGLLVYWALRCRAWQEAAQREKLRVWRLLESIVNISSDAIYVKDPHGRYLFVNHETCRVLGRSEAQLLGSTSSGWLPAEKLAGLAAEDLEAIRSARPICREERLTTTDGQRIYTSTKGALRDSKGRALGVFGVSRDVTEQRLEEARRHQWAMAFENIRDGVMITDAHCRIQNVNAAFTTITGYSAAEAIGSPVKMLQSGRHGPDFYGQMWDSLHVLGHWQGEIWNRRKNGEIYPQWVTISAVREAVSGTVSHYVGVFTDVSLNKSVELELERLAHYDSLTELPNRALLHERLEQTLLRTQRRNSTTAVLVIDLDSFKTVNDSLGHPAGDELLVRVAARLQERVGAEDLLGRLGGDEFLVVREDCKSPAAAAALARDLLAALAAPLRLGCGVDAYVTASIGISLHPVDGSMGVVELLRDADAAMYRAKEQGRNRFCFYTSNMTTEAAAKLEVEAALSQAMDRGELLLYYQPKIDARSGRVHSAEALLRWNRQDAGLVPPGQFIPLAEQSSLILDIGSWVINEACRQIRAWLDADQPVVRLAVNVAARQFAAGDLDSIVAAALRRHDVDPQWLELEITEGMLIAEPAAATAMLGRLKALGVKLSLDDFGTGYSSLGYLQHFPLDALKIDRSFVSRIGQQPDGAPLVEAVIALAHRLRLRVVAEGVEDASQAAYLVAQGCDEMQGYHFGPPAPPESLQEMLEVRV
ncbi:MAG: EAL domain-containing protein [Paucibacter sp.]|nr:EAL domain-containing protein [Roseateles sp.]